MKVSGLNFSELPEPTVESENSDVRRKGIEVKKSSRVNASRN